jgi:TP901 family phage tail tape measure protein
VATVSNVRSVIVRFRAEMAQFKREWDAGTDSVRATNQELEKAKRKASEAEKAIDKSGTAIGRQTERLTNNRDAWDEVGSSYLRVGAGLTAMSVLVGKAAMDWESAWAGVTKTVDGTDAQMMVLEGDLRELAKTLPATHTEIAAVAEAAGQLGVAREDVTAFTRTMIDLSETTDLTADDAATSIAQLMNVMQTAPGDVDRLGSTLVRLGNDGASTESQIIQMAQRIAGAGEIVGLTEADVLGLANALASSGIEVEAGGSAISSILIDISKAVATNSAELETWASVAGVSADEFAARWSADPAMALADFTEGLGQMADNGENVFGVLADLGQSDIRVTRALLNMANSGDLLRDSLRAGAEEWDRNTALADEAAKRYDTTAAQAQVAWNNIKDNAIDAGQGVLPIVSTLSDVVVGLGTAFGSLPDPLQGAVGVLAGVSGVSLLAMGGLMKLGGTVTDVRNALDQLEIKAPRTGRALSMAAKGAAILGAALIAVDAGADLFNADEVANVEKFTGALLRLSEGGDGAGSTLEALASRKAGSFLGATITGDVESLSDAIDTLDASKWDKFLNSGFGESKIDLARDVIEQTDAALTSLVQSGAVDEAAAGFDYFADAAEKSGVDLETAKGMLPGYSEALAGLANEQKKAALTAEELSGGSKALEMRLSELSPDAEEAAKALEKLQDETRGNASSFLDFTTNLDDAKLSFDGWLDQLEDGMKAQEEWADNLIKATARGVDEGVIAELEKAGPEGARLLAELADASEEEIDRVNDAFGSVGNTAALVLDEIPNEIITQFKTPGAADAVDTAVDLARRYDLTPDQVETILRALDYASEDIGEVRRRLSNLDGDEATVQLRANASQAYSALSNFLGSIPLFRNIQLRTTGSSATTTPSGGDRRRAGGGGIFGPGGPRDDLVPVLASNNEHMWTAAEVEALGGHGAMYALRTAVRGGWRPQFAVGGAISDAWDTSYRAAAAAYSYAPTTSLSGASAPPTIGPLSASADLAGGRLAFDTDGFLRFVDGRIDVAISAEAGYQSDSAFAGGHR